MIRTFAVAGALLLLGCGLEQEEEDLVDIDIVGMMVGPAKVDGTFWDGPDSISQEIKAEIANALLQTNPYVGVAAIFAEFVSVGTKAPDPFGDAQLFTDEAQDGEYQYSFFPDTHSNIEDTYTPLLKGGWRAVPLESDMRIRVNAMDEDVAYHDVIGTAEIPLAEIRAALASEQVHHVNVADQTHQQLLFIDISVRRSGRD